MSDLIDAIHDDHRRIGGLFGWLVDSPVQSPDTARDRVRGVVRSAMPGAS